jgi:hypothetical protein
MNKEIMKKAGFSEHVKLVEEACCPFCGTNIILEEFRDEISRSEFKISGLCQKCQDKAFGTY